MSKHIISQILTERIVEQAGYYGFDIRNDYSGRGMFGDTCFGVTCNNIFEWIYCMIDDINNNFTDEELYNVLNEFGEMVREAKTDSMGLETILYFPNWSLPEEENTDED